MTTYTNDWFNYILANSDKPWDYKGLSENPNITWEYIESNPDKPWNYANLSENKMSKHPFFQTKQLNYVLHLFTFQMPNKKEVVTPYFYIFIFIIFIIYFIVIH